MYGPVTGEGSLVVGASENRFGTVPIVRSTMNSMLVARSDSTLHGDR